MLVNEKTLANIARVGALLAETFKNGGKVLSCGNGGSMSDAMHFAEELTGRYRLDRPALPAVSISDATHMSCVANDYGYEHVFARYVDAHGKAGDIFLGISTSGKSKNVIAAAQRAKEKGLIVIALTGQAHSLLEADAAITICTPAGKYADRVQELHIKVLHILIELVERDLFPENYVEA